MKGTAFNKRELEVNYIDPLAQLGVMPNQVIAFTLDYNQVGKAPAGFIKDYLDKLLPALDSLGTSTLYCTDSAYFKVLAGVPKAEPHHGYVMPCKVKGFDHMNVVLGLNYQQLIYNPELQAKLNLGLKAVATHTAGTYQAPGSGIIHSAQYPESVQDIAEALKSLHQYPSLTCDIEAFSLKFNEAGIGTIAFAWDKHNGIAFACDYEPMLGEIQGAIHGIQSPNPEVRALLREFFETYEGELIFHSCTFDAKPLIYNLWMKDLLDTRGLLDGLDIMCRKIHDTKIMAYLATNSTAGNVLGLKSLAQAFAGNWAKDDIKDIRRIPLADLLQYNLVDALCTHYVKEQCVPVMKTDKQVELYTDLMMPSQKLIIQMELTGMPMSRKKVTEAKTKLEAIRNAQLSIINGSAVIKAMNLMVQTKAMEDANAKLKVKQHPLEKFADVVFNPNSGPQLQVLLYELMQLPVIDFTDSKLPATGAETIEKLINHTLDTNHKELLAALIAYGKVTKILSTFIPAFEGAISKDGSDTVWLHGSFNLGGTVSGRLSSSDPNLQNIPAGSLYGKLIKECFMGPENWLFCGADFSSLEDRINALLTKDPQKLKVYTDGYDSHSLRAQAYFPQHMPDIRLVNESENLRTFKIVIDGQTHLLVERDSVKLPDGSITKVEYLCL